MERQHTHSSRLKSIAGAVAGLAILILLGNVDGQIAQVGNLFGCRAADALGLLPSIVLSAWQALRAYAFDHQGLSACPVQMLVSFWPVLHALAVAA